MLTMTHFSDFIRLVKYNSVIIDDSYISITVFTVELSSWLHVLQISLLDFKLQVYYNT